MTQPVYNMYRVKGTFTDMLYRVNIHTGEVQFDCTTHWANSWCTLKDVSKDMTLVAKNVRIKHENR